MQPLDRVLRRELETTVKEARDVAEAAARAALGHLGVGEARPFEHLSKEERDLRQWLRAHGRQLGDVRASDGTQAIVALAEEVAYEHWHRMLFARFLAENDLLMYPDPDGPVPVTLAECADLAVDEGARSGWELAARYAARMLPQIFRVDSRVFELSLPPEHEQKLERKVEGLAREVFQASDALGWVYQFWQSKRKDEVNASEVKIGARELPAVTQLFTEPYMVAFLLDNALGAWWAARRLAPADLASAGDEDELRRKASLPGVPLEYLRFVRGEDGLWTPAAGTFDGWPPALRDLEVLDPCCGSGHFLVAVLQMLAPMRVEMEGLSLRDAVDAVLRDNLHGLEIDPRCVELAVFALAMTAWRMGGGYRVLPTMSVACSGLSVGAAKEEWQRLAEGNRNLRVALGWMYDAFKDAPVLGSLFNPARTEAAKLDIYGLSWDDIARHLENALAREQGDETREAGVAAHGLARAATMLAGQYHWVVTNVPYLLRRKQGRTLADFCERHYPDAKTDLATVFLRRCLEFGAPGRVFCGVLPQNWLFLTGYRSLRESLLKDQDWRLVARLGPGAFDTIGGEVVKAALLVMTQSEPDRRNCTLDAENGSFGAVDVSAVNGVDRKAFSLAGVKMRHHRQSNQLRNPDARVVLEETSAVTLLSEHADYGKGSTTGDRPRFVVCFWELLRLAGNNTRWLDSPVGKLLWSGRSHVTISPVDSLEISIQAGSWIRGRNVWGRNGVSVGKMAEIQPFFYAGEVFDDNIGPMVPRDSSLVPAIWAFLESGQYLSEIRKIDQNLKVTAATLTKVPFDIDHWRRVAAEQYPHGLPAPYTDDPTQWIFHGHPCGSVVFGEASRVVEHAPLRREAAVLQVAVARLLGYRWPAELDAEMELADPQREWVTRCEALLPFVDDDGIVCIPAVRGEAPAADRLLNLLAAAYGPEWSEGVLGELLADAGCAGKTLEVWLRDSFFAQHCEMFHQRPFIWHVWDGLRDGFSALVHYHALDRRNLETLIYTYLGDWIQRQKENASNGVDGSQDRLAAAVGLQKKLELILQGEAPHDIFVRWKPLHQQPPGWEPDLNDGVRLNIRPFMSVPDVKVKDAGVLRIKPKITWQKDRGKDVATAPWYNLGPTYGGNQGDRINDHHLSLAEKSAAREKARSHA